MKLHFSFFLANAILTNSNSLAKNGRQCCCSAAVMQPSVNKLFSVEIYHRDAVAAGVNRQFAVPTLKGVLLNQK